MCNQITTAIAVGGGARHDHAGPRPPSNLSRSAADVSPTFAYAASFGLGSALPPTIENGPRGGPVVREAGRPAQSLRENLPRSVFTNRASFPFVVSSRNMAEYTAVTMLPKVA